MADRWYYAHAGIRIGPCTARQLQEAAAAGGLLPTDTVWREGTPQGALAKKVKNLFPIAQAMVATAGVLGYSEDAAMMPVPVELTPTRTAGPAPLSPEVANTSVEPSRPGAAADLTPEPLAPATLAGEADLQAAEKGPPALSSTRPQPQQPKTARALAIMGARIVSQDGTRVHYTKQCTVCGAEDSSRHTMPIRQGRTRVGFFCRKCRKNRAVEIQGITK
jgi:hypothetical protein